MVKYFGIEGFLVESILEISLFHRPLESPYRCCFFVSLLGLAILDEESSCFIYAIIDNDTLPVRREPDTDKKGREIDSSLSYISRTSLFDGFHLIPCIREDDPNSESEATKNHKDIDNDFRKIHVSHPSPYSISKSIEYYKNHKTNEECDDISTIEIEDFLNEFFTSKVLFEKVYNRRKGIEPSEEIDVPLWSR